MTDPATTPDLHRDVPAVPAEAASSLLVAPGGPLAGEVAIGGAKNSALKIMAATLLAPGTYRLSNVPRIADVEWMTELLAAIGSMVERLDDGTLRLTTQEVVDCAPPDHLVTRMRASTALIGPLLSRCGEVKMAMPGGDDFGQRPVNLHVESLQKMGADVVIEHGAIVARAQRLRGASIAFDYPSVGATETVLLAAATADGETVIDNAAREPEIADLAAFLNRMGARVIGAGSPTIWIRGVAQLGPASHAVVADRVEAATFVCALGAAGGEALLLGARDDHLTQLIRVAGRARVRCAPDSAGLWVQAPIRGAARLAATSVATLPYPGIATDCLPLLIAMLCTADGVSYATENIYTGRFRYITELARLGADIAVDGHHLVVRGVSHLRAGTVTAHDIRAGAAMVIGALAADGPCTVVDAHHIDRGYEQFDAKLSALGVDVRRV